MAYVRPIYDRQSDRGDPGRKPVGYEVRYRDTSGRQRTKGGFRRRRDADSYVVQMESGRQRGTLIPHADGGVRFDAVADVWVRSIYGRHKPNTVEGCEKLLDLHGRRRATSRAWRRQTAEPC